MAAPEVGELPYTPPGVSVAGVPYCLAVLWEIFTGQQIVGLFLLVCAGSGQLPELPGSWIPAEG